MQPQARGIGLAPSPSPTMLVVTGTGSLRSGEKARLESQTEFDISPETIHKWPISRDEKMLGFVGHQETRIQTTVSHHFTPTRVAAIKTQRAARVVEDVRKLAPSSAAGRPVRWLSCWGRRPGRSSERETWRYRGT